MPPYTPAPEVSFTHQLLSLELWLLGLRLPRAVVASIFPLCGWVWGAQGFGVAVLSYVLARVEGEANGWVEPAVILGILLLNAVVGTWQESSAQSALDALQKLQPDTARCLRGGTWQHAMPASQLVPGDIIELRVGDSVPADARLLALRSTTFSSDEGSLTGESAVRRHVARTPDCPAHAKPPV